MPMKTQQLLPEVLEMDMRKWFKEAQYGMMAHWGLYSLLGGEWNGKKKQQLCGMDPGQPTDPHGRIRQAGNGL